MDRRCRWLRSVDVPATAVRVRGLGAGGCGVVTGRRALLQLLFAGVLNAEHLLARMGKTKKRVGTIHRVYLAVL